MKKYVWKQSFNNFVKYILSKLIENLTFLPYQIFFIPLKIAKCTIVITTKLTFDLDFTLLIMLKYILNYIS